MKRDMDLIRDLLFYIEERGRPNARIDSIELDGRLNDEITEHLHLLHEAGLIDAIDFGDMGEECWLPQRLTWEGHDFLDAARDETRWNKAKEIAGAKGGALSFDVLKALLVKLAIGALS